MGNKIAITGFDYSQLDKDTASKLEYYVKTGYTLHRKHHIQFIAEFGEVLSDARKLLGSDREKTFVRWAAVEFDLSKQTIYNYVNSWDRVLSNGLTAYTSLTPTALYLLSRDDTPKAVRDKVLRIAPKQDKVTKADVKKLLLQGVGKGKPGTPVSPGKTSDVKDSDTAGEDGRTDSDGTDAQEPTPQPPGNGTEHGDALGGDDPPEEDDGPEEIMKQKNSEIESFCRGLLKFATDGMPTDEWLKYNGRGEHAMQKIKDACSELRTCKCSALCPKCDGEGCVRCLWTGRVTKYMLEQLS